MKKTLLFISLFLLCSEASAKIQIKPFDAIGVKNLSRDITATVCANGLAPSAGTPIEYNGSIWDCSTDDQGAGAGSLATLSTISEDGSVVVASADTVDFRNALDVTDTGGNTAMVSVDIATTSQDGAAMFDGTNFKTSVTKLSDTSTISLASSGVSEDNLKFVDSPADEDVMTYETTTGDFEWHTCAEITGSADLCDGSDATGAGGGLATLATISEDGTAVVASADTVDFRNGLTVASVGTNDARVSADLATTSQDGVAMFDSTQFKISVTKLNDTSTISLAADAVSADNIADNSVTLATHTVGDYVGTVTEGNYIDIGGSSGENANVSVAMDPSEVSNVTWSDGSQQLVSWDVNVVNSGASPDITTTYGDNRINWNTPIETGRPGSDGALTIYSEQGNTDFLIRISPDQAMTANTLYTMPSADGTSAQVLHTDGSGKLYFDTDDGAGGGAPTDAQYLTLATNGSLSAERVLTESTASNLIDGGANGTLLVSHDIATTAALGVASYDSTNFSVRGDGGVSVKADGILESNLKAVDTAADEECLTYETTDGDFEWQSCGSGSGDITDVFNCSTGDCNSITTASGDLLDIREADFVMSSQDRIIPRVGSFRFVTSRDSIIVFGGSAQTGRIAASQDAAIPIIQQKDFSLVEPDQLRTVSADFPIMNVDSYNYPSGIKITALKMFASTAIMPPAASNDATYAFQEWTTPLDNLGVRTSIDSIAITSADNGEVAKTSGFQDSDIAAGSLVFANLASSDINWVKGTVYYYAKG